MDLDEDARIDAVEAEINLIESMSLPDLRTLWTARWGLAPRFRSVDLLRRLIAWRLQVEHFGGLNADTKILLRRSSMPRAPGPPPGSRLTGEFRGVLHQVDVGEDAFTYQGSRYGSLSAIARTITGTRWNGPRFFGLRNAAPTP
ncbi:MAG: hypothetical protein JWQ97_3505, partial [Phenylobacterium sp.]|nr:hypothetical protein [Phenylobacterium sp.]